jgi:hypothetical protein
MRVSWRSRQPVLLKFWYLYREINDFTSNKLIILIFMTVWNLKPHISSILWHGRLNHLEHHKHVIILLDYAECLKQLVVVQGDKMGTRYSQLFTDHEGSFLCSEDATAGPFILTWDLKDFLNLEVTGSIDSSQFSECWVSSTWIFVLVTAVTEKRKVEEQVSQNKNSKENVLLQHTLAPVHSIEFCNGIPIYPLSLMLQVKKCSCRCIHAHSVQL